VEKLADIVIFLHKQIRDAFTEAGKWHYSIGILDISNVSNNFPYANTSQGTQFLQELTSSILSKLGTKGSVHVGWHCIMQTLSIKLKTL
jgi:hypothetical protein